MMKIENVKIGLIIIRRERQRICCKCNRLIEGKAYKVGKCKNDGTVFWAHPECVEK